MSKLKTVTAFVSAAVLAVSAVPASFMSVENTLTAAAVDDCNDDWLHAEGSDESESISISRAKLLASSLTSLNLYTIVFLMFRLRI